jgi:hypothetical protein
MRFLFSVLAASLILGVSGGIHGLVTERWGVSERLRTAASRLEAVPLCVGEWQGQSVDIDARMLTLADVAGCLARSYVHPTKGEVRLLFLCGRPGPIWVHTPDMCYPGIGYSLVGEPERSAVPNGTDSGSAAFWTARFRRQGPTSDPIRIFWSWNAEDQWSAPDHARVTLWRSTLLYKLYVIRRMSNLDEPLEGDACIDLLRDLLPEVQKCVVNAS